MARPKSAKQPSKAAKGSPIVAKARAARRDAAVEARALVADITEKKRQISDAFYDIGVALEKLATPRLYAALGYASFEALAKHELELSRTVAYRLMAIPAQLTRKRALALGQTKALALIELAAATPESDTAEELAKGKVTVRGHRTPIEPRKMTSRAILRAAQVERRSHGKRVPAEVEAQKWAEARNKRLTKLGAELSVAAKGKTVVLTLRCPFERVGEVAQLLVE